MQEDSDTNIDPSSLSAQARASSLRSFLIPTRYFSRSQNKKWKKPFETRNTILFLLKFFWPKRNGCETTMTRNRRWKETFTEKEKRLKSSKITFVLKTLWSRQLLKSFYSFFTWFCFVRLSVCLFVCLFVCFVCLFSRTLQDRRFRGLAGWGWGETDLGPPKSWTWPRRTGDPDTWAESNPPTRQSTDCQSEMVRKWGMWGLTCRNDFMKASLASWWAAGRPGAVKA